MTKYCSAFPNCAEKLPWPHRAGNFQRMLFLWRGRAKEPGKRQWDQTGRKERADHREMVFSQSAHITNRKK
jgi:hypothetical protein